MRHGGNAHAEPFTQVAHVCFALKHGIQNADACGIAEDFEQFRHIEQLFLLQLGKRPLTECCLCPFVMLHAFDSFRMIFFCTEAVGAADHSWV